MIRPLPLAPRPLPMALASLDGSSPGAGHPAGTGQPSPARPASDDAERPLVLLVGESPALRAEIRVRIEEGYRAAEAGAGPDALDAAVRLGPDLIVADVSVSDRESVDLLESLRDDPRTRDIPVVLLSVGGADTSDALALAAGLGRFLYDWSPSLLGQEEPAPIHVDDVFVAEIDATIRERMADVQFGTGALAEAFGSSPRQLRRRLTEATGETPAQRIRRVRMEAAAEMLAIGVSVKEVGYAVGFASESGFRYAFQSAYGVAPSAYSATQAPEATERGGGPDPSAH